MKGRGKKMRKESERGLERGQGRKLETERER